MKKPNPFTLSGGGKIIERFLTTATILQSVLDNPDDFIKKWELTVYDLRPQVLQDFLVKLLTNL